MKVIKEFYIVSDNYKDYRISDNPVVVGQKKSVIMDKHPSVFRCRITTIDNMTMFYNLELESPNKLDYKYECVGEIEDFSKECLTFVFRYENDDSFFLIEKVTSQYIFSTKDDYEHISIEFMSSKGITMLLKVVGELNKTLFNNDSTLKATEKEVMSNDERFNY